jgi:signal transduction histidine kinase
VDEGRAVRRYRGRTVSRLQKIDVGMAAALLVLGIAEAIARDAAIGWFVSAVVNASAVLLRRRQPVVALLAVIVVQAVVHDATYDTDPLSPFLAELILLFTVGYELHMRQALLGLAAAIVYVSVDYGSGRIQQVSQGAAQIGFYLLAWGGGRIVHGQETRRRAAEVQVVRAEEHVAEERARIARELHDAVAHSVSVMVLQVGAVRRLLGDERPREREVLAGVEELGRQAVGELHTMLGILRRADAGAELAPQPSLRRVGELVEQVRSAGLDATLNVSGSADLAPGLDMSAYRIVQEALTNALRHAPGARVSVTVEYGRELVLEVIDDGARRNGHTAPPGSGHGLVGMRERAALYGGSLEAGPRDGGFAVRAVLPTNSGPAEPLSFAPQANTPGETSPRGEASP